MKNMLVMIGAAAAVCCANAQTLNDGLAVYLPFDSDMANKSTSGVAVQAPPEPSATDAVLVDNGFVGKCLDITSSSSTEYGYLKLAGTDTDSLTYGDGNTTFSAIIWVRHGAQDLDPVFFGNKDWVATDKGFLLAAFGAQVNMHAANGSSRVDKKFIPESSDIWTFYAVICDKGSFSVYQGKSGTTNTLSKQTASLSGFSLETGCPFYIGQSGSGTYSRHLVAAVDDFALWTRALTEDDIVRIYECGRTGMELGDLLEIDSIDAPTMSVVASGYDSVSLSFGGRRTQPLTLGVAYGTTDGGTDKYAWESFSNVAEIAVGDASYTFTVPDWMKTGLLYRFFLMQTNNLPYAKEVECVKSDGTAHINTGVSPRRWMTADFDVMAESQNGRWDWIFGAMASADKKSNFGLAHCPNDFWHIEVSGGSQKPSGATLNELHHVKFDVLQVELDGVPVSAIANAEDFIESGWPVNIFRNIKNGGQYDQTLTGRINSFSLFTPERTARDFNPAVDENGVAGMFDAVTGRFYPSASSTALTAGADRDSLRRGWVRSITGGAAFVAMDAAVAPVTATFTGGGSDACDFSDSDNWDCRNADGQIINGGVPTSYTDVTVSGLTVFSAPTAVPAWRSLTFVDAKLASDADWRGLDPSIVSANPSIDVNGHTLYLDICDGAFAGTTTVTDSSSGAFGSLVVDVPAYKTVTNGALALNGNLKLVKTGEGVYVAANTCSYTGGTHVMAGTVRLGAEISACLGTGLVTVGDGTDKSATLDAYAYAMNSASSEGVVLAGGTLTSTRTGDFYLPLKLTVADSDSYLTYAALSGGHDMYVSPGAVWNLGGRTLLLTLNGQDPDFYVCRKPADNQWCTISNGTIRTVVKLENTTTQSGWVQISKLDGMDGLTLDIGDSDPRLLKDSKIWNFTSSNPLIGKVGSSGMMEIYGTYTPNSTCVFEMKMMNGSTLDLTAKTGTWSTAVTGGTPLAFADGATVTVDLSGRTDLKELAKSASSYVITWESRPSDTVTFMLDAATAKRFSIATTNDGLKIFRKGFIILFH